MNTRMPDWLHRRALTHGDKPALITEEKTWTFSSLDHDASRAADYLRFHGIDPQNRVALLGGNSGSFTVMIHGLRRAGAVVVPINVRLTPTEIRAQLAHVDACALVADETHQALAYEAVRGMDVRVMPMDGWQQWQQRQQPKVDPLAQTYPHSESRQDGLLIDLDNPCLIMFTSGTTGQAKGATLTYGNLWWNTISSALNLGLHPEDGWLATLPLFHIGGLSILIRSVVYGIPVVLHERFDPRRVNEAIDSGQATIISVVSAMLARMMDERRDRPYPPTLRTVLIGGGPVPPPLLERALKAGVPLVQTYGLTETASQVATLPPEEARRKAGSAGKPLMGAELRVDANPGDVGEIYVRGPVVTPGYWGENPGARRDTQGWFPTGDLGYLDDEGFLYVVSRRTDLIISGGENVYPAEIESVLLSHSQVREAVVVPRSDPKWGQVPVAFLVMEADEPGKIVMSDKTVQELDTFCRARLAPYKVPVAFFPIDEMPRNAGGKVLRTKLRELAQ